jgi:exo-beta-1,3-glucanase (GH17 family)
LKHIHSFSVTVYYFIELYKTFPNSAGVEASSNIGVNYGVLGNNLPSPYRSIELLTTMKAGRVKIYDANPDILRLLSTTNLKVSIMIPNHEISGIAANQSIADEWVRNNIFPYYQKTLIRYLLVGNEVLSYNSEQGHKMWHDLVPAMRNIKRALNSQKIGGIKIGTPLAMDVLESTFPPSSGTFRSDLRDSVIRPMLKFLDSTNSFFFIDAYPYFPWSRDPKNINLDFALFRGNITTQDPGSGLIYRNLLDQMLDSVIFAMSKLGYSNIKLVISETAWPNSGDIEETGTNIFNAATYNRNLIQRMTTKPPIGTPARPGVPIPTFIFSLFDENQKPGRGTERHWGLLHTDGTPMYDLDLTGKKPITEYEPLPVPKNNAPYKGKVWCVAANGANEMELAAALSYACNVANMTCDALSPGNECYEPVSVTNHASYVFSTYWAKFKDNGATCYFNGLAIETTKDPSKFLLLR